MSILSINWTNAFIVTFLGITIVFIVLCLLIALLYVFGIATKKLSKDNKVTIDQKDQKQRLKVVSGAESAAIAMALHLYYADIHDEESDVITIKNISNRYSPWSAKVY